MVGVAAWRVLRRAACGRGLCALRLRPAESGRIAACCGRRRAAGVVGAALRGPVSSASLVLMVAATCRLRACDLPRCRLGFSEAAEKIGFSRN